MRSSVVQKIMDVRERGHVVCETDASLAIARRSRD